MYFTYSPSPPSTSSYSTSTSSSMEIPSSNNSNNNSRSPSCAYPSWPQGPSLSYSSRGVGMCSASQSTSFIISDEELFPTVFDDSSSDCTPPSSPNNMASRSPASPSAMCEPRIVVGSASATGGYMEEKQRRQRKRKSSAKVRQGSDGRHMSPIIE